MNHNKRFLFIFLFFLILISLNFRLSKAIEIGVKSNLPYVELSDGCSYGSFIYEINFEDMTYKCRLGNNASGNLTYEVDPVWASEKSLYYLKSNPFSFYNSTNPPPVSPESDPVYTAENGTIVRSGSNDCIPGQYSNEATISNSGVALTCSQVDHAGLADLTWSTAGHTIDMNLNPSVDNSYSLGSFGGMVITARWNNLYLTNKTVYFDKSLISPQYISLGAPDNVPNSLNYILPQKPTLPSQVISYIPLAGGYQLIWMSLPSESDPIYVAQNTTIVRAGTYSCTAGQYASNITINSSGVTLNCTTINSVPTGMLAPFYLTTCPSGWALANGSLGTPDLRNRFIVANGTSYTFNTTGGSSSYTPTGRVDPHRAIMGSDWMGGGGTSYDNQNFRGDAATINPPYYSLIYCMKT